ncbi:hypothetical protein [Shinella sp.]|uniref:sensor histidine kinase n=1 Tax=Shinella sp. TaxID=1870904 RepID=UPI0029AB6ABF|nr:hypothetical protein [Shinella sp.]MDX3978121.1 hypothetical protein [Shinella sp.]
MDLSVARWQSWSAVATVTLAFFLSLSAIVFRGSRTIDHQSRELESRVAELTQLLSQNDALKSRIQRAAAATTALNESYLRNLGADLHDGPAQLVAFAALRVDSGLLTDPTTSTERREKEASVIKTSLDEAMTEIRTICSGLVLPHIESISLEEMLAELLNSYRARTGKAVELHNCAIVSILPIAAKICIYRFIQEALNNGYKHAAGVGQWIDIAPYGDGIEVQVGDAGPGLSRQSSGGSSIGLAGMRDRVESLGGAFSVATDDLLLVAIAIANGNGIGRDFLLGYGGSATLCFAIGAIWPLAFAVGLALAAFAIRSPLTVPAAAILCIRAGKRDGGGACLPPDMNGYCSDRQGDADR